MNKEKLEHEGKLNELKIFVSNLNQELENKDNIINELKMRNMELQKDKSLKVNNKGEFSNALKKDEEDLYSYLNKSDDNITLYNDDKSLQKKVMKYELEIKYLKEKLRDKKHDFNFEIFDKNEKIRKNPNNVNLNMNDLLYHLYNQSKVIEKLN